MVFLGVCRWRWAHSSWGSSGWVASQGCSVVAEDKTSSPFSPRDPLLSEAKPAKTQALHAVGCWVQRRMKLLWRSLHQCHVPAAQPGASLSGSQNETTSPLCGPVSFLHCLSGRFEQFLSLVRWCRHPCCSCPLAAPVNELSWSSVSCLAVTRELPRKMDFLTLSLSCSLHFSLASPLAFASEIPDSLCAPLPFFLSFFHFSCFLYSLFTYFSLYYLSCPPLHSFNPSRAGAYKLTPSQPVMWSKLFVAPAISMVTIRGVSRVVVDPMHRPTYCCSCWHYILTAWAWLLI